MEIYDPLHLISRIKLAGNLLIGVGSLDQLDDSIKSYSPKEALIVTDENIEKTGMITKIENT